MGDLGLQPLHLGIGGIHFGLGGMQGVGGSEMGFARLLHARLDLAQGSRFGFDAVDGFRYQPIQLDGLGLGIVAFFQPEQALAASQLGLQIAILLRHHGLAFESSDLTLEFATNVVDTGDVLARIFEPALGFLAPFLVLGDASRLFEEATQFFWLRLDDARNHALADDRVGTRPQASAEEEIDHVAAAHVQVIDVVAGIALAVENALDRYFGILVPLAGNAALMVVEKQLDARPSHFLATARALEDHVLDRLTA